MNGIAVYVFNQLPGVHHTWTLAVSAVSPTDARAYVNAWFRGGGKLIQTIKSNGGRVEVKASCGGITRAAEKLLAQERE